VETAESDFDLMRRVQDRDASALAELYDRYGSRVYSLAVTIVGEGAAAEEVTQDTFMKLWSRPEHYRVETGRFAAWLLTIARRSAIDRLRRDRRTRAAASLDAVSFPEPRDIAQEDDARWRELRFLLDDLPVEQREVIVLAFYRGLSQSDIAEYLHIPLGTIKTRLRLAMDKLRAAWAQTG
jgi:RNA polymerase sigma-70 factor (ECF subfamily)